MFNSKLSVYWPRPTIKLHPRVRVPFIGINGRIKVPPKRTERNIFLAHYPSLGYCLSFLFFFFFYRIICVTLVVPFCRILWNHSTIEPVVIHCELYIPEIQYIESRVCDMIYTNHHQSSATSIWYQRSRSHLYHVLQVGD